MAPVARFLSVPRFGASCLTLVALCLTSSIAWGTLCLTDVRILVSESMSTPRAPSQSMAKSFAPLTCHKRSPR